MAGFSFWPAMPLFQEMCTFSGCFSTNKTIEFHVLLDIAISFRCSKVLMISSALSLIRGFILFVFWQHTEAFVLTVIGTGEPVWSPTDQS